MGRTPPLAPELARLASIDMARLVEQHTPTAPAAIVPGINRTVGELGPPACSHPNFKVITLC